MTDSDSYGHGPRRCRRRSTTGIASYRAAPPPPRSRTTPAASRSSGAASSHRFRARSSGSTRAATCPTSNGCERRGRSDAAMRRPNRSSTRACRTATSRGTTTSRRGGLGDRSRGGDRGDHRRCAGAAVARDRARRIRLVVLVNDVSLRGLIPASSRKASASSTASRPAPSVLRGDARRVRRRLGRRPRPGHLESGSTEHSVAFGPASTSTSISPTSSGTRPEPGRWRPARSSAQGRSRTATSRAASPASPNNACSSSFRAKRHEPVPRSGRRGRDRIHGADGRALLGTIRQRVVEARP